MIKLDKNATCACITNFLEEGSDTAQTTFDQKTKKVKSIF